VRLRDVVRDLPIGEPSRRLSPREALRAAVHGLRAPRLDGLPPITGGLMGYASYEAAGLLDGHPAPHAAEAAVPPVGLLLIDRAVVFDHWRQRLVLVVHAQRGGYDGAVEAIEGLADKLASAAPPPLLSAARPRTQPATRTCTMPTYRDIVESFRSTSSRGTSSRRFRPGSVSDIGVRAEGPPIYRWLPRL
jgi:anthranilate synthase component 1